MALRKSRDDPQQYIRKKDFKKAIEIYRAQIKADPDDPNKVLRLGDCLVNDNQVDAAVESYKKAAKLFAEQGFLLKAIGVNKKIVKIDPSQEEVHEQLSSLYQERGLLAPSAAPAAAAAAAAPAAAGGGGPMQFDMEESDGPEIELNLGPMAGEEEPAAPDAEAPAEPEPDLDLLGADLDGLDMAEDVSAAAAPADPLAELGADDIAADALAGLDELPDDLSDELSEDISVDALGDALAMAEPAAADGPRRDSDSIGKTPLFSDFTAEELVQVVNKLDQTTFGPGEAVVTEGEAGDSMFVIVSGAVRVVTSSGGREIELAELGEGDFFGEGSLLTGKPRTATIRTTGETELLSLNKAAVDELIATHPRIQDVLKKFFEERAESTVRAILKAHK